MKCRGVLIIGFFFAETTTGRVPEIPSPGNRNHTKEVRSCTTTPKQRYVSTRSHLVYLQTILRSGMVGRYMLKTTSPSLFPMKVLLW